VQLTCAVSMPLPMTHTLGHCQDGESRETTGGWCQICAKLDETRLYRTLWTHIEADIVWGKGHLSPRLLIQQNQRAACCGARLVDALCHFC
jgi:hypothetical protein